MMLKPLFNNTLVTGFRDPNGCDGISTFTSFLEPFLKEITQRLFDEILNSLSSMTFKEAHDEFGIMAEKDFDEVERRDDINEAKVAFFLINLAANNLVSVWF
jgi:hypothetical protein